MKVSRAYDAILDAFDRARVSGGGDLKNKDLDRYSLRHDVDHDISVALRLAQHEANRGFVATYYLLPTAEYWKSDFCIAVALEIQQLGHSIGLHNNTLAQWIKGEVESPYQALRDQLERLRSAGIEIERVSSHGDRACYEDGFNNSWIFKNCWEGNSLLETWVDMSAEGVYDPREQFQIKLPKSKILQRPDGSTMELGQTSLSEHGLISDVTHLPKVLNISDSGGDWSRGSPEIFEKQTGEVSLLLHPEYWVRNEPSLTLILSCARSGTKWLHRLLSKYSGVRATHEYILNNLNTSKGKEHLTSAGLASLDSEKFVRPALSAAQTEFAELEDSWIEINVYLANFFDIVKEEMSSATAIALFRHPRSVVASLFQRGWFEAVIDVHHVAPAIEDWAQLNPFQRVCEYVAHLNKFLIENCSAYLRLEDLTKSPEDFQTSLAKVGLTCAVPLKEELEDRVDPTTLIPQFSVEQEADFEKILGEVCSQLGYALDGYPGDIKPLQPLAALQDPSFNRASLKPFFEVISEEATPIEINLENATRVGVGKAGYILKTFTGKHTHVILGGSKWKTASPKTGWPALHDSEYIFQLNMSYESDEVVTLILLEYDEKGRVGTPRRLLRLRNGTQYVMFRCKNTTNRFDLAVYAAAGAERLSLGECSLKSYSKDFLPKTPKLLGKNSHIFKENHLT